MNTGKVKIIHNAINVERFTYDEKVRQEVRAQLGISGGLVLGHVGRFEYQKNHPYLLDVFAAVCRERQDGGGLRDVEQKIVFSAASGRG